MFDLDQIAAALSLAPSTLADIKIEAAVGIGGHDISYPGVSIKGSLKKMADLHQIKKLQIPFVFLVGFVQDTMKRLQDSLPRNIELLTLTYDLTEQEFRAKATLRSKREILDQADLILRLDWACVDARTKNQAAPGNLDSGVVFERHHSLNWLINYMN